MTITLAQSLGDLSVLVEELGEHTEEESMGIVEEFDDDEDVGTMGLQESYNTLLEKTSEYAKWLRQPLRK